MKVVYIAGPYRGANAWETEQNIRRAEVAALAVWRLGAAALCPHTNCRYFQGVLPDAVWLAGDLAMLQRCDAVLMTPDWNRSAGARLEQDRASDWGLPVFYTLDALEGWLEGECVSKSLITG